MFDDLRDLYQEVILDHGRNPRNRRHPDEANRTARGENPLCGDRLTVYLTLDDKGVIEDVAFEGRGCAISTASASMMTEIVRGRSADEARELFQRFHALCTGAHDHDHDDCDCGEADQDALDRLQVLSGVSQYPARVKCATLPWHTLVAALKGEAATSTE